MPKLPRDIGSREIITALKYFGFQPGPVHSGSHKSYVRKRSDGGYDSVTVVLGKKTIPTGTVNAILKRAELSREDLTKALGR